MSAARAGGGGGAAGGAVWHSTIRRPDGSCAAGRAGSSKIRGAARASTCGAISLRWAARRPLGYGPEVFTAAFPRFESAALARAYPDFLHESPHNIFLDAWVSQGIPGLLILAGFCWIGLTAAWRQESLAGGGAGGGDREPDVHRVHDADGAGLLCDNRDGLQPAAGSESGRARRRLESAAYELPYWAGRASWFTPPVRLTLADRALELAKESSGARRRGRRGRALRRIRPPAFSGNAAATSGTRELARSWRRQRRIRPRGCRRWCRRASRPCGPRQPPRSRSTRGTASPRCMPAQNDFANTRNSVCERPSRRGRIGLNRTGRWRKYCAWKADWTKRKARPRIAADRNGGKNPEVARTLDEIRAQRATGPRQP